MKQIQAGALATCIKDFSSEVGPLALKSNGDEALSDESLLKSNSAGDAEYENRIDEAFNALKN